MQMEKSREIENKKYFKKLNKELEKFDVLSNCGENGKTNLRFDKYTVEQLANLIKKDQWTYYSMFK